ATLTRAQRLHATFPAALIHRPCRRHHLWSPGPLAVFTAPGTRRLHPAAGGAPFRRSCATVHAAAGRRASRIPPRGASRPLRAQRRVGTRESFTGRLAGCELPHPAPYGEW